MAEKAILIPLCAAKHSVSVNKRVKGVLNYPADLLQMRVCLNDAYVEVK